MRLMTVRYAGHCRCCGAGLRPGMRAFAVPELDATRASCPMLCTRCGDERRSAAAAKRPAQLPLLRNAGTR